jgi:quinol-cytochrome oxidoreductase complex cytochrome b subunit
MYQTTQTQEGQAESTETEEHEGRVAKLVQWFDERLGLSYELLRPAPAYSINPFYWLGALAVVAFAIQGITGVMMMIYYIPTPTQAYSSTLFIFQHVSYGTFLESVHLYTAYAMIMLAFMHMMRGYFVSVHKKPRELMWIVGMVMGFVTLGFGFTGYLMPWTVVSKSATDVGVGMISALPQPLSSFLTFLMIGGGGAPEELLRFYDLHVVVLPGVLLLLLVGKMYMLETHGVSEPVTGPDPPPPKKRNLIPIFPDLTFYLLELACLFGAAMLLISVAFPVKLGPEYSPQAASQTAAQPDWYFLWIYQILKIKIFEGAGLSVALGLVTVVFLSIILLPFIDRGTNRRIAGRMKFEAVGLIFVAEVAVLTIWGYLTPGQIIPTEEGVLVLGGTALMVALVSLVSYRLIFGRLAKGNPPMGGSAGPAPYATRSFNRASLWTAGSFVFSLALGTFGINGLINSAAALIMGGYSVAILSTIGLASAELALAILAAVYLLYRLDLGTGSIKRRVKAFEVGWKE